MYCYKYNNVMFFFVISFSPDPLTISFDGEPDHLRDGLKPGCLHKYRIYNWSKNEFYSNSPRVFMLIYTYPSV